jgi:hypothetical protein
VVLATEVDQRKLDEDAALRLPLAGGGSHSGRSTKLATTIIGKAPDDIIDRVLTGQQVISSAAPAAGFAQFLCRYAFRIVVLAALMFAIRAWPAFSPWSGWYRFASR